MKYPHDRDRSLQLFRTAVPLMSQQAAPLNPTSYTIWYEHVAGMNPALSEALHSRLSSVKSLSQDDVKILFDSFVDHNRHTSGERLAQLLSSLMQEIARSARDSGADIDRFHAALEASQQQLSQPIEQLALTALINGLIGNTMKMRSITAELATKLDEGAQQVARLQAQLKRAESEAVSDALTGLLNRRGFERAILADSSILPQAALLFLDLDHFKRINDSYGHSLGDKILRAVAGAIQAGIKGRDIAARLGGEEFAVLLPETSLEDAAVVAEQLRKSISRGHVRQPGGAPLECVTVSIGVTRIQPGEDLETLTRRADAAMYAAKREGRNRVSVVAQS